MKTTSTRPAVRVALWSAAGLAGLMLAHAQETGTTTKRNPLAISPEFAAELQAVEQLPTIDPSTLPYNGRGLTYYSAQFPYWPPVPGNSFGLPLWDLGNNRYLIDDLSVDFEALDTTATAATMSSLAKPMGNGGGGFGPLDSSQIGYPYLTIAPTGTNQLLITVIDTNSGTYFLQMTPMLANTNYPWGTITTNGTAGQSNFTVNIGPFADEFFRVLVATNIPGQGIAVFIDSPANGATVQ